MGAILLLLAPWLLVVFVGAPFVRTLKRQRVVAAGLFELEKGDVVVDLGAGDGSVVVDLARAGYKAIGYELNPILVIVAWFKCFAYKDAKVVWANYWNVKWPEETKGVFIFSAERFMGRLGDKLHKDFPKGVQLVSFGFELPGIKPVKSDLGLHLYRINSRK